MKRLILILFLLCLPFSAATAQTPISEDQARTFYKNCAAAAPEQFSKESHDMLCACTGVQMMKSMTYEDLQDLNKQGAPARAALNKMIINVYAPCIEHPAKEHYYKTCVSNPKTESLTSRPKELCGCLSNQITSYLKLNAKTVFEDILTRNPETVDPMQALTEDPRFTKYVQTRLLNCYAKFQ